MTPSRDLDAEIARKVFGFHVERVKAFGNPDWHYKDGNAWIVVPQYSRHIASAWLVVEKVKDWRPNPGEYGLEPDHPQCFTVEHTGEKWCAGWAPINLDGNMTVEAEADTAPLAICLAALKAINSKSKP